MCSSPGHFDRTGEIELAVQYSTHPPADWVHTKVTTNNYLSVVNLVDSGEIELAVQYSTHPPADWVHTKVITNNYLSRDM